MTDGHASTSLAVDFIWNSATDGRRADMPFTVGWTFTATQNIDVTALGVWDLGGFNPNRSSHAIGLWTDGGALLASEVVAVNSPLHTSPLGATIRFVSIPPVELAAGQTYRIGAEYTSILRLDFYVDNLKAQILTSPSILFGHAAAGPPKAGLAFPGLVNPSTEGFFGPNFMFTPVPEVSTATCLVLGLGLCYLAESFRGGCKPARRRPRIWHPPR